MPTQRHISTRGSRRPTLLSTIFSTFFAGAIAAVLLAFAPANHQNIVSTATAATSGTAAFSYGWPVKPFDREHPVRAVLGDPRTVFHAPPTVNGVLHAGGSFSFHQGIDISAPDGTAVYPVKSGVVSHVDHEWIRIDSDNGSSFEYWHIHAAVAAGDHVIVNETVLGHIMRPAQHVHLTEYDNGRVVNPLGAGHIGPYTDTTTPKVTQLGFHGTDGEMLPNFIRGGVQFVASAEDMPTMPVPGIWHDLATTPARLSWHIRLWTGKVVIPERVSYDHRSTVPPNTAFWSTYARGTYQNMAVFSPHYSYLQGGCYLFKLTPQPFDTRTLRDGVYDLVVTATDIRGNSGSLSQRFTVHNRAGWIGS